MQPDHMLLAKKIRFLFSVIYAQVKSEAKSGLTDLSKSQEKALLPIINKIYSKKFKDMNEIKSNYPGVDYKDFDNELGLQMTITVSQKKVNETVDKTIKYDKDRKIKEIWMFFLTVDNISSNILIKNIIKDIKLKFITLNDLINEIINADLDYQRNVFSLIENQYSSYFQNNIDSDISKNIGVPTALSTFKDIVEKKFFSSVICEENIQHLSYKEVSLYKGNECVFSSKSLDLYSIPDKHSKSNLTQLSKLDEEDTFRNQNNNFLFTFIDLFAGIGGIRMPFQQLGGKCVFSSEWDKFAQRTYAANYGEVPSGDITQISAKDIPDHDILMGGFPCQAFSQAGLKKGFEDTRGTMFFEIQRILCEKRPKIFLLENVKQLKGHDKGNTLRTIINILTGESDQALDDVPMSQDAREALGKKLNYWVDFKVLRAADFGVPQSRERIFIVGFDKDYFGENFDFEKIFKWPTPSYEQTRVGDILESQEVLDAQEDKYTISDKLWAVHQRRKEEYRTKGNGFGYSVYTADSAYTNTISARYYKDGSEILIDQSHLGKNPRKLTPRECARLQGFPDNFIVDAVSQGQIYKQFGNSACVKVIQAIAKKLIDVLDYKRAEK